MLGVDLALSEDIDLEQFKFLADYCERRVGEDDAVVVMTHEPYWVIDDQEARKDEDCAESNLRELMEVREEGGSEAKRRPDDHTLYPGIMCEASHLPYAACSRLGTR